MAFDKLIFEDHFDGDTINRDNWQFEIGFIRNHEPQYYTDRPCNAYVEDSMLHIVTLREDYEGAKYTSASLNTEGKFSCTYGRIEMRAKLPWSKGIWPAFWTLGENISVVNWPHCGEIDIMEATVNSDPESNGEMRSTLHFQTKGTDEHNCITGWFHLPQGEKFADDFHVYAVEWEKEECPGAMVRLDMSEYMEKHSVSKLIGSPPGYVGFEEGGQLTEKIRRKPYSVVLFDEIEKAHPDVFNIMLQVLEDGILTDSQGRRVDFKNTIIIMTSNAGASGEEKARAQLGFVTNDAGEREKNLQDERIMNALKATFRPEFLNRVDDIIIFSKLSHENICSIASLMLSEVGHRIKDMGIDIKFDDSIGELVAKEGFDPVYGARPLRRAIVRMIEDTFSTEMLEGRIKAGDKITATASDGKVEFKKN